MDVKLVAIGKIVAPHGVRGDVRVVPLTDFPERFCELDSILLEDGRNIEVENAHFHKQFILLKLRGINTRNDIDFLRGKLIYVKKEDLVPLPTGHYYQFEIIGLDVYTVQEQYIGKVTDILSTGSNDVYIAEKEGQKPVLIPALKDVVRKIDLDGGKMIVELQEEWD